MQESFLFFFFFSSRRRHTRSLRDWSSDVCSSDLAACHWHWRRVGTTTNWHSLVLWRGRKVGTKNSPSCSLVIGCTHEVVLCFFSCFNSQGLTHGGFEFITAMCESVEEKNGRRAMTVGGGRAGKHGQVLPLHTVQRRASGITLIPLRLILLFSRRRLATGLSTLWLTMVFMALVQRRSSSSSPFQPIHRQYIGPT